VKVKLIVALATLYVAGLLVGCDSKPTPDTTVPTPPAGHQKYSKAERNPKPSTPTQQKP